MKAIKRLFVANRGEIAARIVQACRKLDIEAVVGVSAADRETLAARLADRSVCVGQRQASESYLKMEAMVVAALGSGCDAIHPGYGLPAERSDFQHFCAENGLMFVGPGRSQRIKVCPRLRARVGWDHRKKRSRSAKRSATHFCSRRGLAVEGVA